MNQNRAFFHSSILGAALALGLTTPIFAATQSGVAFSEEPTHGSMQVSKNDEWNMVKLTKFAGMGPIQATEAAIDNTPGTDLEVESEFLVWQVRSVTGKGITT